MIPSIGTANLLEILWTLVASMGLLVSLPNWWASRRDEAVLRESGINGINKRLAQGNTRVHASVSFILGCFTYVGIVAMWTPANPTNGGVTLYGMSLGVVLIVINFWCTIWSYRERQDRHYLMKE